MKTFLRAFIVIKVLVLLAFQLEAQTVTDPSRQDATYDARKLQSIRPQPARGNIPVNKALKANRNAALNDCFIPVDDSFTAIPRNDDGSYGPLTLPFTFDLYGSTYGQLWINTNGNVTFTRPYSEYNASGFPTNEPMVAGFWADIDTRAGGQIYYKLDSTHLIVTWNGVGYYNTSIDKLNTFQIILTQGSDPIIGPGQNVAFYYKDMQWTTGSSSGGSGGFGGTPATVGVNKGSDNKFIQVGRFNLNSDVYDGPGGLEDGVNYLDDQCFRFNATSSQNIPPSVSGLPSGNTITMNVGDSITVTPTFIGPEVGQQVLTTVNTRNACKVSYTVTNGQVSAVQLKVKADTCNIGTRVITFTATDDGTPVQATDIDLRVVINKLNQTITFPDPGVVTGAFLPLQATSTSLLPVQFQVVSGPGYISGNHLYFNGIGQVTVQALHPGNNIFNAAVSAPVTVCAPLLQPGVIAGPVKSCINSVAEYTVPNVSGANYTWLLTGPGQITAIADNKVTVQWQGAGTGTLTVHYGANCNIGDPISKLDVQVVNTRLSGTFTKLLPSDGNSNLVFPINFSWFPVTNAVSYDIYIWPEADSRPATPTIQNINGINYMLTGSSWMQYGASYKWQVVARSICDALESQVQTFRLRYLPDLVVDNVTLPATGFSGQPLSIKWEVKNIGQGATLSQRWRERLYLSKDAILDDQDIELGSVDNVSELGAGKNYVNTVPFTLPNGISDNYYVFVITDAYDQLLETNQSNNQLISVNRVAVQLTPPPDLQVTSLVPLNFAFSGQDITVNWRIGNVGSGGTVAGSWTDDVYLSKDEQLNVGNATRLGTFRHTGALLVNEGYNNTQSVFRLPEGISGRYFIYVQTDVQHEVYEHAQEGNNTRRSDSINIILTPPIDLTVPSVTVLPSASNGEQVQIDWRVENAGGSGTDTKRWVDAVYLSRTATFNKDSARLLGNVPRAVALAPGEGYDGKGQFRIPGDITGDYYIYVITDADLQVFEYTYENNNTGRSAQRVKIQTPDLTVSEVRIPAADTSGQTVTISWDLHNSGTGRQYGVLVTDRIYVSPAATFNAANSIILKEVSYQTGELASGASARQQTTVKLPNGISGNRYIYVETNYDHKLYETNFSNNIKRSTTGIAVTLGPSSDLRPIEVTVGDTATAGDLITVRYRVKNTGVKTVDDPLWTDKLFISTSLVWDTARSVLLRELAQTRVLPKDSVYEVSSSVKLPGNLGDSLYRIYVFTDGHDNVYEHNAEGNNISRGMDSIFVKKYPPIDLSVSAVSAPAAGNSGSPVKVSWTVGNNSGAATLATQWEDALYLSTDTVLDAGDRLVKAYAHRGVLPGNGVYTEEQSFVLPNGVSGSFYLLLVADHTDQHHDANRRNNYLLIRPAGGGDPTPTVIGLTPPPDLVVQAFMAPDEGTAGQPVVVRWEVQNTGTGVTAVGSWTDKVYLSTNLQLDAGDVMIGSTVHNGALLPGAGYRDSLQVFLPGSVSGNYVIIFKADANDNVYEHGAEDNTATALSTISTAPLSDLVVTAVEAPASVAAGEPVTIRWRLKNTGANPATGYLQEGIYFSKDKEKQITDVLLGSPAVTVNLPPQAEMERSFTTELKGVSLGDYYTLIHTDILNNISETSDTNNITASTSISSVSVPELPLNVVTARPLAKDKEVYYRIEVADSLVGESLLVVLKGDSLRGNNELYLRHGQVPTRAVHDFAHVQPYQGNQEIIIPELKAGTYYLLLYGSTASGNIQPVTLKAAILPFEIRGVNAESGGNTGPVTIQVNGSKLGTVTSLQLRNVGGSIAASKLSVSDPTSIYATLSLKDAVTGVYDVVAENAKGETAILKDGFTIAAGMGTNLVTNVVAPPSTRPINVVSLTVEFTNAGNTDIINPVLKLSSLGGAPIGFTLQELEQHKQELTLTLQELNGPVGILRPGAKGVITVYAKATTSLGFMLVQPANR